MDDLFCLWPCLIVLVVLFLLDDPPPRVDKAQHRIEHIGDEAHRHMDQLTTHYREYLDEQTRRYR